GGKRLVGGQLLVRAGGAGSGGLGHYAARAAGAVVAGRPRNSAHHDFARGGHRVSARGWGRAPDPSAASYCRPIGPAARLHRLPRPGPDGGRGGSGP
nr:hypothetical protein [Tanacetum cinerariifolium]